jgi:hypothetical protein
MDKDHFKSPRDIVTKQGLEKIRQELKAMGPEPQHNAPAPSGMESYSRIQDRRRQMLMRVEKRADQNLNQASRKMSHEWDRNS